MIQLTWYISKGFLKILGTCHLTWYGQENDNRSHKCDVHIWLCLTTWGHVFQLVNLI